MGGCCTCCKRFAAEWKKEALDFDDFNKGQWINVFGSSSNRCLKDRTAYSIFRFVEALIMTGIYGWSTGDSIADGSYACYFIYLTHLMLTMQLLYFWFAWWTTRQADRMASGETPKSDRMPCYVRTMWVLQDIVIPGSFLVFVLYWALVVPEKTEPVQPLGYFTHGVNFVMQMLDVFLSRQPYHLLHGIYIAILGVVYISFTGIYYAAGGTDCNGNRYIYKAIDWSAPDSVYSLSLLILLVAVPVINLVFWFTISMCFPQNYKEPDAVKETGPSTVEIA